MSQNYLQLESAILDVLKEIYDPEIPVNIYDLGLIYEIKVDETQTAHVLMTVTSPNCPVAETLPVEVHDKVAGIQGIKHVNVVMTFNPPWSKEMMTEAAMLDLGLL
jgi:FeS assembly SUF system protein